MNNSRSKAKAGAEALSTLTDRVEAEIEALAQQRQEQKLRSPKAPFASANSVPAPNQLIHFAAGVQRQSEELERVNAKALQQAEELQQAKSAPSSGFTLKLSQIRPSPYQLLALDEDRVLALADNLRNNPLNSPVVVRETAEKDVFEQISGHHRVESYRRLGRESIQAVLSSATDAEAERLVFYDNLLAPNISDYEKYLGFARRRSTAGLSQRELANEAGVSATQVNFLFAFEKLPEKAQALIRAQPNKATSLLFHELAALSTAFPERVTAAVASFLAGEKPVTALSQWVQSAPSSNPAPKNPITKTVFKRGDVEYALLKHKENSLHISFESVDEAERVAELLRKILRERSQADS